MKHLAFSIALLLIAVVGKADTYQDNYRICDLTNWYADDTAYDPETGRLDLNRGWGSHKYNFGILTTGIAGEYSRVVLELSEPCDYDNILLWTCETEPWNEDRIDVNITRGDSYFSIMLREGFINQIGITSTSADPAAESAHLMIKSLYLEMNPNDRANLNLENTICFDNYGDINLVGENQWSFTAWGWAGFWYPQTFDYNDFSSLELRMPSGLPGRLDVAIWNGDAENLWGGETLWYNYPEGTTEISIPITSEWNCIAFSACNSGLPNESVYEISEVYLVKQQLAYEVNGNEAAVVGIKVKRGEITVPAKINLAGVEYEVTSIANDAFYYQEYLDAITLSEGLTSIGQRAFAYCWIPEIEIPATVTSIGDEAFYNCHELSSVKIKGNALTELGTRAFSQCRKLDKIELPSSLVTLGDGAFSHCSNLEQISMSGVKMLGNQAFEGCAFDEFTIDYPISKVGMYAWADCNALENIWIECAAAFDSYAFDGIPAECMALGNYDLRATLSMPQGAEWWYYDRLVPSDTDYCTYYVVNPFVVPAGCKAAVVEDANSQSLTLNWKYLANEMVPANTGVILEMSNIEDDLILISKDNDTEDVKNLLAGSADDSYVTLENSYVYYALESEENAPVFSRIESNFTNPARTAYLKVPASANPKDSYNLLNPEDINGLEGVMADSNIADEGIFTLTGVKLPQGATLSPGFYIINGKKTFIH